MAEKRVLPADVYDTLELSAYAFGGLGAGKWDEGFIPFCIGGHAAFAGLPSGWVTLLDDAIGNGSGASFVDGNNRAVQAVNIRKRSLHPGGRISWKEYTRELNIVRGD